MSMCTRSSSTRSDRRYNYMLKIFEKNITRSRDNIRIKTAFSGQLMATYIHSNGSIDALCSEMREICRFDDSQEFTMKWVDEDGDPCTISSQQELDEAIRLYRLNKTFGVESSRFSMRAIRAGHVVRRGRSKCVSTRRSSMEKNPTQPIQPDNYLRFLFRDLRRQDFIT
uniref:PB1 domain-containing protein n=1 Tax=Strigamia maritima TaxID=126957 RepID=T1JEI1_STRMM